MRVVLGCGVAGRAICNSLAAAGWVPGGLDRPYSAPATLGKEKEYKYFIRKLSTTVIANNDEIKELINLTATVPFDDRINHHAALLDIKLPLIQSFLKEVDSKLLKESADIPFSDLCRQMAIVNGGNEYLKPRNVGLLFFHDEPEKYFPYIQIDVVYFPEDEGGDIIEEAIFKKHIKYYEYEYFNDIKEIGSGGFGNSTVQTGKILIII